MVATRKPKMEPTKATPRDRPNAGPQWQSPRTPLPQPTDFRPEGKLAGKGACTCRHRRDARMWSRRSLSPRRATGSAISWSSPQPWGDTVVFELYRITTPDAGAEL